MQPLALDDPSHIGPYRLLSRLGAGGMGRVYLARVTDAAPDAPTVALKLIRPDAAEQDAFRRRFTREVAAARRVNGRWTARVLDADTESEVPWVATEYIPGPTLRAVVRGDFGPLPSASAHILAHRLGQALGAIHASGLVHRDLKPSNILLTVGGPRVIDFGIAHTLDASLESTISRTGSIVGTPEFMSPEQVRGERITPAGDVFSLGSVLVYAATGRSPFRKAQGEDTGAHALMFRIAYEEPELSEVPEAIADLVRRCLAKAPGQRPTVAEIVDLTRRAPDAAWLPARLLERLDRVAARPLPRSPQRERRERPAEPGIPDFPDFPDPAEVTRDPLDAPEAGILPPRVVAAPSAPAPRHGRRHVTLALVAAAGVLSLTAWGTTALWTEAIGSRPADTTVEELPDVELVDDLSGMWRATLDEGDPLLSFVLDVPPGAATDTHSTEIFVATADAICKGRATLLSRTERTAVVGRFDLRRIDTEGAGTSACGLPWTIKLVADQDGDVVWERKPGYSVATEPVSEPWLKVSSAFAHDWYDTTGRLWVAIRTGRVGDLAVHGVDTRHGRHCEWEASLLDVQERRIVTSGARVIPSRSSPGCASGQFARRYVLEDTGEDVTLTQDSETTTDTLRPRRPG
ncbi:serine/threonine-protein kinase [Streptomyces sp. NPDC005820]|uniref:serine/threonine-protein kinase n=1 Tax=Streptomyces sp. NPDC005820 TaxID=3157069 RepID=UPI0033D45E17